MPALPVNIFYLGGLQRGSIISVDSRHTPQMKTLFSLADSLVSPAEESNFCF